MLLFKRKWFQFLLTVIFFTSFSLVTVTAQEKYKDLQIFTKVLNLIQKYYVEDVDATKLIYGGIKGMISSLDPHSSFLPPEYFKEFQEETSGEFNGIGVEISVQNDILTVISPIEDTPAWKAGIKAGDKIVTINGESTKGFSLADAAQKMKTKDKEKIKLGIMRDGFKKPQIFMIERGTVKVKSVKFTDLENGYAYFKITGFIENTFKDFDDQITKFNKKNKEIRGIIIDLRNNPGGLLDQAIKLSDFFLTEGVIVSTMGRGGKDKDVVSATSKDGLTGFPMVLIINEYSASASEIFAGALQDNNRAVVLGQRSFGKGSVQTVVKLGDGSGLKLTVARYYTPKGTEIQAEGIKPDLLVEDLDVEALEKAKVKKLVKREADIEGHLESSHERDKSKVPATADEIRDKMLKEDYQVLQALNYLKAAKVFSKSATSVVK